MSRRVDGRNPMVGSGTLSQPDRLEQLDDARSRHERLTRARPAKSFREVFEEKLKGKSTARDAGEEGEAADPEAARDEDQPEDESEAMLGLAPGQAPAIANPSNGRRSGKVIVKG